MDHSKNETQQVVDPLVSKEKYQREVETFLNAYSIYRRKGILLLGHSFPVITLAFLSTKVQPWPLFFAVRIDFTNYDLEPPSIRFIDPFSEELIHISQLPHQFPRKLNQLGHQLTLQPLVLAQADGIPFFCIPGVREYHNHPAHTGDSWLLHRGESGEGTLGFLVEKLYQYGVASINGLQIQLAFQKLTPSFDVQSISE